MTLKVVGRHQWPELFALMQQARVSGLPDTLAELEEHLATCFSIGNFLPGESDEGPFEAMAAAYIVSPDADGVAFLQIIGFDAPSLKWVVKRAFENLNLICIWTQVPRTQLAACLKAGFHPTSELDIGNPTVAITASTLKLLDM